MKQILFFPILLCLMIVSSGFNHLDQFRSKIVVKIDGFRSQKGNIMIALYNDSECFDQDKKALYKKIVKLKENEGVIVFDKLPSGQYAFKIFHDENVNLKLDKNIFGIPKEGFAFSNNAKARFGPPKFKSCVFAVAPSQTTINRVKLKYML